MGCRIDTQAQLVPLDVNHHRRRPLNPLTLSLSEGKPAVRLAMGETNTLCSWTHQASATISLLESGSWNGGVQRAQPLYWESAEGVPQIFSVSPCLDRKWPGGRSNDSNTRAGQCQEDNNLSNLIPRRTQSGNRDQEPTKTQEPRRHRRAGPRARAINAQGRGSERRRHEQAVCRHRQPRQRRRRWRR